MERIIRQKRGNAAAIKDKATVDDTSGSGSGGPTNYDIDEFVEIFGHSLYNNGPDNTVYQHMRNCIQLLTPTPAQYFSTDMKDKVYCYSVRQSLNVDSVSEVDESSSLLKPKHF